MWNRFAASVIHKDANWLTKTNGFTILVKVQVFLKQLTTEKFSSPPFGGQPYVNLHSAELKMSSLLSNLGEFGLIFYSLLSSIKAIFSEHLCIFCCNKIHRRRWLFQKTAWLCSRRMISVCVGKSCGFCNNVTEIRSMSTDQTAKWDLPMRNLPIQNKQSSTFGNNGRLLVWLLFAWVICLYCRGVNQHKVLEIYSDRKF